MAWSLVTVTYNSEANIRKFWGNVALPRGCEWIVVDNASNDGTVEAVLALGGQVLELEANRGFAFANNVGFRASHGEHVAFVNPDVRVEQSGLDVLESVLSRTDALIAPQLLNEDGSPQPNGRGWPYLLTQVANRIRPSGVDGIYRIFASPEETEKEVVWLTGAVIAGRRETLAALGPWDESYFLYYEDVDLCLRARNDNIPCIVAGDVTWVHGWARESADFRFTPWRRQLTSAARFYLRHPRLIRADPHMKGLDR